MFMLFCTTSAILDLQMFQVDNVVVVVVACGIVRSGRAARGCAADGR